MSLDEMKNRLHADLTECDHNKAFDVAVKAGVEKAVAVFPPSDDSPRVLSCARRAALKEFAARMGWDD